MHKLTRVLYSLFGFVISVLCKNDFAFAQFCTLEEVHKPANEDFEGRGPICDYMKAQANLPPADRDRDSTADGIACLALKHMAEEFKNIKGDIHNYYLSSADADWLQELDTWCNVQMFQEVAEFETLNDYDGINEWFVLHKDSQKLRQFSYCDPSVVSVGGVCYSINGVNHIKSCPQVGEDLNNQYRFFAGENMEAYRMKVGGKYDKTTTFIEGKKNSIVSCAGSYMVLSELKGDCDKILLLEDVGKDMCYYDYALAGDVVCDNDSCVGHDDYGDYVLTEQSDKKQAGHGYYTAEQAYCENASDDKPECFVKE